MDLIKEETIQEIQRYITPQLQPTRATKSSSISPMQRRIVKGIKAPQEQEIPQLNLKQLNFAQQPMSLTQIESNRNNSKDNSTSKRYLNPQNYMLSDGNFSSTRNNYNQNQSSTKNSNWQEAYSPNETFSKVLIRNTQRKQALPQMVTSRTSNLKGFDQQYNSLNYIRSVNLLPDLPDSAREGGSTRSNLNGPDSDRRKGISENNIRLFRKRLGSQSDISKYTAQSNSHITQSLNYLDEIDSKNIFQETKIPDQKVQHAEFLKDLFKEIYPEYQTLRLGQKLHVNLYFGESKLVKLKMIDKNFPIVLRTFVNSGYFTIYFSKKYTSGKPPDHFLHDYMIQQTEKTVVLYDGLSPSEEIKYIFMHITSQTNCDFEVIAQTQKLREDFLPQNGSSNNLKQKGFIQFPSSDKMFNMEIAEIKKRRKEKSLKLASNKDFIKINSEVAQDYRDQIKKKLNDHMRQKADKIVLVQKKQQIMFEQKFEKNLQWLSKNDQKKQERLKIEGKEQKIKFDRTWLAILELPKIFHKLRFIIFKNKMWNKRIERAKSLLNKFFKEVLMKLRSKTGMEKMMMYSSTSLNAYANQILERVEQKSGYILQKFLIKSSQTWLLDAKLKLYHSKVKYIQAWYHKLYNDRSEYLNKFWTDICNQLLNNEKLRKLNVMKEAPIRLTKRNSLIIQENGNIEQPKGAQKNSYNIQIRISTINKQIISINFIVQSNTILIPQSEQKKACLKFFRRNIIEKRVLMQRIKLGLLQLSNDIIESAQMNTQHSSQLSPLSPLENLNNSQSETSLSATQLKMKKSSSFFPSPPSSPLKAGKELQKITSIKLLAIKKVRKSKRQKSPNQKNQNGSQAAVDCIYDQEFVNSKINVDRFDLHSINPYFMMDLSIQDKQRFQFYSSQSQTFLDTIKDSLITKKNKNIYVIKEDDENKLKSQNSQTFQTQNSNRLILHKNKLTPFPLLQLRKNNSLDIQMLSFKKISQAEIILFKKLILDATEQCKDYKGWKS